MPDYIWILSRNSYEGSLKQRPCRLQDRILPDEISGVLWLFAEHSVLGWPMCRGSLEFQGSNAESVSGIMSPNFCLSNFLSGHRAIHDLWQDTICTEFKGAVLELEALDLKAMRPHLHLFWNVAAFMQKNRCIWAFLRFPKSVQLSDLRRLEQSPRSPPSSLTCWLSTLDKRRFNLEKTLFFFSADQRSQKSQKSLGLLTTLI